MGEFNWTCPHCQRAQTVSDSKFHSAEYGLALGDTKHGRIGLKIVAIGCSNPNCKEVAVAVILGTAHQQDHGYSFKLKEEISTHRIRPDSGHKPQPDFIPSLIVQDYIEASRIRDLSPKASATLARRCIQGMIRNFCGISKPSLFKEIEELSLRLVNNVAPAGVTAETVEAIDHVRKIGNIGAHMEKDIDVIVDVDPGEAQALIDLIELLFEEWYIAKNIRQAKLAKLKAIADEKAEAKKMERSGTA
jgi:Domain of unknown function (DUF4145)